MVEFHFITHLLLLGFFCTTAKTSVMIISITDRFQFSHLSDSSGRHDKLIDFVYMKSNCINLRQIELCVISQWSLSQFLSIHKRHSYDSYSIYMSNFNLFLPAVYPIGTTDLQHNRVLHSFVKFTNTVLCTIIFVIIVITKLLVYYGSWSNSITTCTNKFIRHLTVLIDCLDLSVKCILASKDL